MLLSFYDNVHGATANARDGDEALAAATREIEILASKRASAARVAEPDLLEQPTTASARLYRGL